MINVCRPAARVTRSLLAYGVVAGPLYVAAMLVQAALRPGFDWPPRLLAVFALGLIAAGIFVADPMSGFRALLLAWGWMAAVAIDLYRRA